MAAEETTPPVTEEKKKTAKKSVLDPNEDLFARAKAAVLKKTGHKPLTTSKSTRAHVPTGSLAVDYLIGGTPALDGKGPVCPGFPRRHITEVYGPESSGKTTLALSAIAQAQKLGGGAFFIDFEHSLDQEYAKKLGVSLDPKRFAYYQPNTMEEGLNMIAIGIAGGVDIVCVDSVAAMVPKLELDKDLADPAKVGAVAAKLAGFLPKAVIWLAKYPLEAGTGEGRKSRKDHPGTVLLLLNQTRALINTGGGGGHGDQENTSGGKALKFFAFVRLRTSRIKSEFLEKKDPITGVKRRFPFGNLTDVKVVKSKVDAKQGHSTQVFIRYGFGIDDYYSLIETGVYYRFIKKEGAYYAYGENRFQGKDKFRTFLLQNSKLFDELKVKIGSAISMSAEPAKDDDEEESSLFETDDDLDDIESAVADVSAGEPEEEVVDDSTGTTE